MGDLGANTLNPLWLCPWLSSSSSLSRSSSVNTYVSTSEQDQNKKQDDKKRDIFLEKVKHEKKIMSVVSVQTFESTINATRIIREHLGNKFGTNIYTKHIHIMVG